MKISFIKPVFGFMILTALILSACAPASKPSATPPAAPTSVPTATAAAAPTNPAPTAAFSASPTAAVGATAGIPDTGVTGTATPAGSSGAGMKFVIDPARSEVSYSVREQLAKFSLPNDAVGKTHAVAGFIVLKSDGTLDSANSKITVDLNTLKTDESMRDNYVRRNILQTHQYPQATFVPTQISGLPAAIPQSGSVTFKVTGDLTIRDVTKPVTWDVTGTVNNGIATGTATTSFTFGNFNLTIPRVSVVLSVVDKITLNANVTFQRSGN